jgi:hypothetical protein
MGLDLKRLVLVFVTMPAGAGDSRYRVGTGYFLTGNLILTASHVVPESAEAIEVRVEGSAEFHAAQMDRSVAWRNAVLDAVLIRVSPDLEAISPVEWTESSFTENVEWNTTAYPLAARQLVDDHEKWKTRGLKGTLYWQGGAGQGVRELDLGVEEPATPEGWGGISGAPVFVEGRLAGIIKDVPRDFKGGRLSGVRADALLSDPVFRNVIAEPWLELPANRPVLVLLCEARRSELLPRRVKAAIERFNKDRLALETAGGPLAPEPVKVTISEVLQKPEHWFQFIKALCAAPVMIADVTGFEPAVMLSLGIRSVVRRGVTIASTSDQLDESHLSQLPFNIQESKLISHGGDYDPTDPKNPVSVISVAMREGLRELHSRLRYLDLPVYDAVRSPRPEWSANSRPRSQELNGDITDNSDTIVVLCPFHEDYKNHWLQISSRLLDQYPNKRIVRMIDIFSPRLVGQALYEQIRWSKTCVVDWTYWRPNVFFELGVRFACSDTGPICLFDRADPADPGSTRLPRPQDLKQKRQLIELFGPKLYLFAPAEATDEERNTADKDFTAIFEEHETATKKPTFVSNSTLSHDATYRFLTHEFDWNQERINLRPDQLLRASAEADAGRDEQSSGGSEVLFSSNFEFSVRLRQSVYERWIAAWYYLLYRYEHEFQANAERREELKTLGEDVLQALPKTNDPFLKELRDQIVDKIDEFS